MTTLNVFQNVLNVVLPTLVDQISPVELSCASGVSRPGCLANC